MQARKRVLLGAVSAWVMGLSVSEVLAEVDDPRATEVLADTRDDFTLFDRRPLNRQLHDQLALPGQDYRIGRNWGAFAYAVDAEVASVQRVSAPEFSRFHGYFVFDNFASFEATDSLDLNLNLTLFNPSASDGVRVSSYATPGGGLHFHHVFDWAGHRGRVDVLGTDLDITTLGAGLLLENWPLEGALANLSYGDLYLRQYFGGRVFYEEDDIFSWQAGAFDGLVEAMVLQWKFRGRTPDSWYADVSSRVPLFGERVGLSAELAANLRDRPRFGALGRADYKDSLGRFAWHVGYQFRWYQQGFGPFRGLRAPTTNFNLPFRGESYATNSFAYFGISDWFEQLSHTVMAETEVPLGSYFRAFAEAEVWARFVADREQPVQVVATPEGDLVPGAVLDVYYRSGLRLYPYPELPHRLSLVFTNKQVEVPFFVTDPTPTLFETTGHYVALMMEAWL
jgi:hypothetical protein